LYVRDGIVQISPNRIMAIYTEQRKPTPIREIHGIAQKKAYNIQYTAKV